MHFYVLFQQKTAYERRMSDWSSDLCSSDLTVPLEKAGSHDACAVQQHCPWGALANAPIVPDLPVLAAAPPAIEPVPAPVPSLGFAPGIAPPLPPSTGDRKGVV